MWILVFLLLACPIGAETVYEKQKILNEALNEYHQSEDCQSLANIYSELNEEAWAKLYQIRSESQTPLGKEKTPLSLLLAPLSAPKTQQYFLIFSIATFIVLSIRLWSTNPFFKKITIGVLSITVYLAISSLYLFYVMPIEAVVVRASSLYQSPEKGANFATDDLLSQGAVVEVLDVTDGGQWIKVKNEKDTIGFVPQRKIRLTEGV